MASVSTLFSVTRPYAFPLTIGAISVGSSLAFVDAPRHFSWLFFLLSMSGGLLVHAAANLINTYGDYMQGVDVKATSDDRALVDGVVTVKQVYRLIVFCVATAFAILLSVCYGITHRPPPPVSRAFMSPLFDLLALCVCGMFLAYAYTGPPFYWKYKGLGDICTILACGPLLVTGAYYCQLSTFPSLASFGFTLVPGLLADGILHANNTRDQVWDAKCGAVTLPMKLGRRLSHLFFISLYAISFLVVISSALFPSTFLPRREMEERGGWSWMQSILLLPLVLVPRSVGLTTRYYKGDLQDLCPSCGQFAGEFGLLQSVAIISWKLAEEYSWKVG